MFHQMDEFYNTKKISNIKIQEMLKKSGINEKMFDDRAQLEIYCDRYYWNHYDLEDEEINRDYQNVVLEAGKLFLEFCKACNSYHCIISPLFYPDYFERMMDLNSVEIYKELKTTLKQFHVRVKSCSGIEIDVRNEMDMIQAFICGGMKFVSRAKFFLPEQDIVFEPHHHTDFLVFTSRKESHVNTLKNIIAHFPNFEVSV